MISLVLTNAAKKATAVISLDNKVLSMGTAPRRLSSMLPPKAKSEQ